MIVVFLSQPLRTYSTQLIGLAENEKFDQKKSTNFGRLVDGRLVKKLPLNFHSKPEWPVSTVIDYVV